MKWDLYGKYTLCKKVGTVDADTETEALNKCLKKDMYTISQPMMIAAIENGYSLIEESSHVVVFPHRNYGEEN